MYTHIVRGLIRVLAIAITAVGCNGAFAQTPPLPLGASFDQNLDGYSNDERFVYAASSSAGAITNGYITTTAYYTGGTGSVSLSMPGGNTYVQEGYAVVNYWFEVFGPQGIVPVFLSASGSVSAGDTNNDLVGAAFTSNLYSTSIAAGVQPGGNPQNAFSFNQPGNVVTNTPYEITVAVDGYTKGPDKLSASVDPTVQFAPDFDSRGYSLAFSPGALPVPVPVPLPAAAWLLLAGLGGLGLMRRTRTRSLTAC